MGDVLAIENLSIEFSGRRGRQRILQQVSFSIAPGKAYGLVGESGCGKSTVALAAMHYLPAGMSVTGGRVRVDGRDLEGLSKAELRALRGRRIAMVYQDPMASLNPVMTIGRQIAEVALLHGERDRSRALDRARAMLEEVRLPDAEAMLARYPHQLSGGQQQRVVIAMALMAEPALLVMDEPTTGLDVTIEAAILELVHDLRAKLGTAILFISHNLGTVARLCEDIGVLYAGRLVETGPVRAVFKSPAHPYTRGLLAALPDLDRPRPDGRLVPIEGTLTAEDRARPGCAFAPRCDFAEPAMCNTRPIALIDTDGGGVHRARCARLAAVRASGVLDTRPGRPARDPASAPIVLAISGLSKRYPVGGRFSGRGASEVHALTEASLEARAGQTIAIVGESGSGKSTLAKVVTGLTEASAGSVRLGGTEIAGTPVDERPREVRRRIQMVFQNPDATLNPSHSVEFALRRPLQLLRGLPSGQARTEAARLLERVKLPPDLLRRMPHQLSGGQRQRVAIARALAGNPDLIIADEPVSALDVSVQAAIVNLLADLLERSGVGLVIISHDLALVRSMADHVAVMYLGRIVEHGPTEQVFAPPSHPYTEALLAAAPRPDPDAGPPAIVLSGVMPSPTAAPRGCPFASRCPKRIPGLCETEPPPLRTFGPHTIACHLELGE
ncbi:MAG: ABC transporter ATP-binding protein [Hyphomicrobiaceae bacterium]|nr:ABC transporter ATP-binding protein [Hyphomicrobiaceae bacterium]